MAKIKEKDKIMEEIHAEVIEPTIEVKPQEKVEIKTPEETPEEEASRLQLELDIRNTHLPKSVRKGRTPQEIQKLRNKTHAKRVKEIERQIYKIEEAKRKKEEKEKILDLEIKEAQNSL
jgi:hypothetical protein